MAAAPASATQRLVQEITLHNNDTVTHSVTVQLIDGAATRIVRTGQVGAGADFAYSPANVPASENAILTESGPGARISALPAFSLALPPDGSETLPVVEAGDLAHRRERSALVRRLAQAELETLAAQFPCIGPVAGVDREDAAGNLFRIGD